MQQRTPHSNENVAKFFRHYRRGVYLGWTAACLRDGASANQTAERYNAGRSLHRVTPRFVARRVEWAIQVMEEADPQGLILPHLLCAPRFFWWTLALWRAGFTMHDILTLPRLQISNEVRGINWTSIMKIRQFANSGVRAA